MTSIFTAALRLFVLQAVFVLFSVKAAASVVYEVTSDKIVLVNPNGSWGGNLPTVVAQSSNYTIAYHYNESPLNIQIFDASLGYGAVSFKLLGLQIFDNTNGLSSDFVAASSNATLGFNYNNIVVSGYDTAGTAFFGFPGGAIFSTFAGEIGELGDNIPVGAAFDQLIEGAPARLFADQVMGGRIVSTNGGAVELDAGEFTFQSYVVPLPATAYVFLSAVIGLTGLRNFSRSEE